MGSVKDLKIIKKPTMDTTGIGQFHFSDRYSVFDWGEMPDKIENKGSALCLMGAYCFERLEETGIKTHYRGLVSQNRKPATLEDLERPTNVMEFDMVNVFQPRVYKEEGRLKYDYSYFTPSLRNYLIPLEIIYRNGLPVGSSVFKRIEEGSTTIEELGLDRYPKSGEQLPRPVFDVSTKLEEKDRYVTWREAQKIAGLRDEEVEKVKALLLEVDETITKVASRADLTNEDGKIELAFDPERRLMVVDVVGTLDECRFTYGGLQVSKEMARHFYRKTGWHRDVEEAKKRADLEGVRYWKTLCRSSPPKLDRVLKALISKVYMAAANEFTNRKLFDVPRFAEVIDNYRDYTDSD